ncbi:hypothetical protein HN51_026942 [Arachis hypogaea]|nr:F-box/kelch-repeat protein At3g23880 [Arachis hypogaea]QHO33191.1 F-box/kelch-repeat protein [Arachis hypogaea]
MGGRATSQPRDEDDDTDNDVIKRKGKALRTTAEHLHPSATPPPCLPDEIITEILLRLPARLLVQLRSVCNSWKTLISSSQFASNHLRRSITAAEPSLSEPRIAYPRWWHKHNQFGDFSVRSVFEKPFTEGFCFEGKRDYNIIGSCNGLLCLVDADHNKFHNRVNVILWNPCTGLTSQELEFEGLLNVCGFGYDHVSDSYKLVGIVNEEQKTLKPHKSATTVYTFGLNSSWRKIQDMAFKARYIENKEGVFVPGTGTLNWIVPGDGAFNPMVLSLDLEKETHSLFSPPNHKDMYCHFKILKLCVLRNYLAICCEHRTHCPVWLMKEYGVSESWTKLAMIPQYLNIHVTPLYLWENDVLLGTAAPYSRIIRYNLNHGNFKFPVIDGHRDGMMKVAPLSKHSMAAKRFHVYHESLVSPSHCGLLSSTSEMRWIKLIKVIKNPCLQSLPSEFLYW